MQDPTQTLPTPPPNDCLLKCGTCQKCKLLTSWVQKYKSEVDDLISKSNVHHCAQSISGTQVGTKVRQFVGCLDNMWGKCKARFPRPIFKQTEVDKETGAINLKKLEPMINTLTPLVTYLLRCNTDITCLKSGTAVKAVIMYVTDYITKCSLKTHVVFDVIRSTYQKNSELIGGPETQKEKARRLMTKMVNNLSAKMEIGSPMACLYLLQNPDHYTNLDFAPIFWKSFVNEARKAFDPEESDRLHEKVTLLKRRGCIIGLSPIYDYIFRPVELEDMCFYDWVRLCRREKFKKQKNAEDLSDT